ncbi:MAG: hypothetical protein KC646_09625 [Candidatus Cloacimonetes bacterium]|nr:hypothetical protein [Candidatus Cloacimonadota bacterium]
MSERRDLDEESLSDQEFLLQPGYIIFPVKKKTIYSVVTTGIVYTLFDVKKRRGGAGYFQYNRFSSKKEESTLYAYPSILTLVSLFVKSGSKRQDIVVNYYGGAFKEKASSKDRNLSTSNVKFAREVFNYIGLKIGIAETGGKIGRKIAFDSGSGNHVVALVEDIRQSDW